MAIGEDILALDPNNKDGNLLYAISHDFYGRSMSPISAWRKKMPQKIRARIEDAVKANPGDANSYALYGGWHMAVAAKAGTKRAKKMFGATSEEGIEYFDKALSVAADNLMINGNYLMMLYASEPELHDEKIHKMLKHMQTVPPKNDAEQQVRFIVKSLETNLDHPRRAKKIAKNFLGW